MFYVYKITNLLNDKVYVGRTQQEPSIRFAQHFQGMGLGKKMPIHLALQKYGKDNFKMEVIYVSFSKEDCEFAEIYFINKFNCLAPIGYNVDWNTKLIKDNPYLIEELKKSSAVQSIESEPTELVEYNLSKRPRYPIEQIIEIKRLYEAGKTPKEINIILGLNIPHRTMIGRLRALGCDTSNKARNTFRTRFFISDSVKADIIKDFNNGLAVKDLQVKYDKANRTIRSVLVNAGLYKSVDKKICRTL